MTYREKMIHLEVEAKRRFYVLEDILIPKQGVDFDTTYRIITEKILFMGKDYRAIFGEYISFYLMTHQSNFDMDCEMKY